MAEIIQQSRPSPRLCSIYLRDVYSLLPRAELDQCREVSTHYETAFPQYPIGSRPRYHGVEMSSRAFGSMKYTSLYKNGYVIVSVQQTLKDGRPCRFQPWHLHPAFQNCCTELVESSRALIGESIFPRNKPEARISLSFYLQNDQPRGIQFSALNRMTETTAFGLLHMLSHLRHTHFDDILLGDFGTLINPRALDLLQKDANGLPCCLKCRVLSFERVPKVQDLEEERCRIRFQSVQVNRSLEGFHCVNEAMPLMLLGGSVCREMHFIAMDSAIRLILKALRENDGKGVIERVNIKLTNQGFVIDGVKTPYTFFPTAEQAVEAAREAAVVVNKPDGGSAKISRHYQYAASPEEKGFDADFHFWRYPPEKTVTHVLELRLK